MNFKVGNKIRFTLLFIVLFLSVFMILFFPARQGELMKKNFENEVNSIAKTVALGVSIGLKSGDLTATETAMAFAKEDKRVKYILLNSDGQTIASYPKDLSENSPLLKDNELVTQKAKFESSLLSGEVIVGCSTENIAAEIKATRNVSIIATIIAAIFAVIITFLLARNIANPIKKLELAAVKVSHGDFKQHLDIVSNDEIGLLSRSFNKMIEDIRILMDEVQRNSEIAKSAAEEAERSKDDAVKSREYLQHCVEQILLEMKKLSDGDLTVKIDTADHEDLITKLFNGFNDTVVSIRKVMKQVTGVVGATASASSQILASTEEMAAGANEQSMEAAKVATGVEEMTKSILDTSKNTVNVSDAASNAKVITEQGSIKVEETKHSIEKIVESSQKIASIINSLARKSEQIGEITQVIDDIADQTNLLALNAAIEAARAGEQGRGFAVVADEVRKLAERTTKATKEIADTIKGVQTEANEADKAMTEAKELVNNGMKSTEEVEELLINIKSNSVKVADLVSQIAAASEEQSSSAENISQNIEAITTVTQQSATGTQQIARSAEDLNRLTLSLQELISNFKLECDDKNVRSIPGGRKEEKGKSGVRFLN